MSKSSPIFRRPSVKVLSGSYKKNFLLIPDVHLGFEHPKALEFLKSVQALYQIDESCIISLGDMWEHYHLSRWPKGGDYPITPEGEIELARKRTKEWAKAFPLLKICMGNHDNRMLKAASGALLPSSIIKSLKDIYQYPNTWEIEECFVANTKSPFLCIHGDGQGVSSTNLANNPKQFGMSVAFGHFHSLASIMHVSTQTMDAWSFNVGCLIDEPSFVFEYGAKSKHKPVIGCGVVIGDGRVPIFHPLLI
jgi:hypothetical protein